MALSYTDRKGRSSDCTVLPYGLVAHSGRWYLTGADPAGGEVSTFRLDRIAAMTVQSGSFVVPAEFGPAAIVLDSSPARRGPTMYRCGSTAASSTFAAISRPVSRPCPRSRPRGTPDDDPRTDTGETCSDGSSAAAARRKHRMGPCPDPD
ncbi:helix-turn-helix transcriptional regulator [Streptomyces lydicus]|uniref:helix-turn-helix transcriptional regulator n=1 Tax=Streptomyces lydicus TaxID=47763 RepID=UPI001F506B4D|nr:WYL domain-containing protein [Streptomyces lydicus]